MSYRGNTYRIPCQRGGWTNNQNTDLIAPEMFVSPSRNINLNEGGRRKRGGTAKVNASPGYGGGQILGGFDFQLTSTSFRVVLASDGGLYKNATDTIKTGMSTTKKPSFAVFGNELYVCDGVTRPQTWDGSAGSTSNITTPSGDWSGSTQPFQVITHGKGASRRTWFLLGNAVYYSSLGDGKVVSGGTSGKITIDTEDAYGLTGGVDFQGRLIVFSRTRAYIITDDDPDTATWGYQPVSWEGGSAHFRLIVKTPNDLVTMDESGEIYSVVAVQDFGDYKKASLARPAFIDNYVRENVALSSIDKFHATYDPKLRAIKFFMVRAGESQVSSGFTYFIDRPAEEAWVLHDNADADSGYDASCSFLVRASAGDYLVYTGDYSGHLWKLEQENRNDNDSAFYGGFKTPNLTFDNPRLRKHFRRGYVIAKTQGNYDLQVNIWVDGQVKDTRTVSLSGAGGVLDVDALDTFILGGVEFIARPLELGYYGRRIQFEFFNANADQDFFISQVLVDFKTIGALP